jgi:DNA-binding transcriptional ArsR family regulator
MVRQSVSKHLAVLEAANLVTTVRRGREKLHYLNAAPINDIGERMITRRARARAGARRPEARARGGHHRGQTTFVYTTYIRTTARLAIYAGVSEQTKAKSASKLVDAGSARSSTRRKDGRASEWDDLQLGWAEAASGAHRSCAPPTRGRSA